MSMAFHYKQSKSMETAIQLAKASTPLPYLNDIAIFVKKMLEGKSSSFALLASCEEALGQQLAPWRGVYECHFHN